jgi:hypothetical protein
MHSADRMLLDRETFLALPTDEEVIEAVQQMGRLPQVGIFVPDGNRRWVLATTNLSEGSDEFFIQVALTQTAYGLHNLEVFFSHGLPVLFVPLFSRPVLTRSPSYYRLTALKTLHIMLTSDEWLDFYAKWNVRVRVYGDLSVLPSADGEQVRLWITRLQQITRLHTAHTLFLGIGGEPWVGYDAAQATVRFYRTYQREPSVDELIEFIYGEPVPPADFFIMCSGMDGLGALPAFICNEDTQAYYLAAPGVAALTRQTYRAILYDLCLRRGKVVGKSSYTLDPDEREQLRTWYEDHREAIIGLGCRIGTVWVPQVPESGPSRLPTPV